LSQSNQTIQQQKHKHYIVLSEDNYKLIKQYGKYGDTMDTILGRILLAAVEKRKKGELVIS
jgi:hypothetical protein